MIGDDQLNRFVGDWAGAEALSATAWTAAGTAHAVVRVSAGPGAGLIIDYQHERDGGSMVGHGVVTADGWWWFDSYGFVPTVPGTARWEHGELILERSNERGRTRTTLAIADGRLEQRIDSAVPADAELAPLLRGAYAPLRPSSRPN